MDLTNMCSSNTILVENLYRTEERGIHNTCFCTRLPNGKMISLKQQKLIQGVPGTPN